MSPRHWIGTGAGRQFESNRPVGPLPRFVPKPSATSIDSRLASGEILSTTAREALAQRVSVEVRFLRCLAGRLRWRSEFAAYEGEGDRASVLEGKRECSGCGARWARGCRRSPVRRPRRLTRPGSRPEPASRSGRARRRAERCSLTRADGFYRTPVLEHTMTPWRRTHAH